MTEYLTDEQAQAKLRYDIMGDFGSIRGARYATAEKVLRRFVDNDPKIKLIEGDEATICKKTILYVGGRDVIHQPSWATYASCLTWQLCTGLFRVFVYDGDSLNGLATDLRYRAAFELPWWELPDVVDAVNHSWTAYVNHQMGKDEEAAHRLHFARKEEELLAKHRSET